MGGGSTGSARRGGTGKSPPRRPRPGPLDLWRDFARHAAKDDPTYDPVAPGVWPPSWPPATYHLSTPSPKRLLYFTKDFLLKQWVQQGPLPVGLGGRRALRAGHAELLRLAEARGRRRSGCRSSSSATATRTTSRSSSASSAAATSSSRPPRRRCRCRYLGIDDRWLGLCAAAFTPPEGGNPDFKLVMVEMTPLERRHLEVLLQVAPEVERLVGPRCMQILRAGRKLELEGACSRGLYADGFCQRLLHHVQHASPRL